MANYNAQIDALFPGIDTTTSPQDKKTAELFGRQVGVSSLGSFFAGIGSGFFKIPEGLVSLGANLIDLGADTDTASTVEEFFAKINPFDEYAEATTAGKISEILTNIAVPVGVAGKVASTLTKGALAAKKSGNYFKLLNDDGVPILEGLRKGQKLTSKNRLAQLNRKGQAVQLGSTSLAAGLAESVFVDDPGDVGTFGDLFGGGPTQLDRGKDYDPEREVYNRLKLGIEGTLFTGILSTAGKGIKQLADSSKAGRIAQTKTGRALDWVSQRLRPRSGKNPQYFTDEMAYKGNLASDLNAAENIAMQLDSQIDQAIPLWERLTSSKSTAARTALAKQANKTLLSNLDEKNIKFGTTDAVNRSTGELIKDPADVQKLIAQGRTEKQALKEAKNKQVLKVIIPDINLTEAAKLDKLILNTAKQFGKDGKTAKESVKNILTTGGKKGDRQSMIATLNDMRQGWARLLEIEGRSLDSVVPTTGKSVLQKWKDTMPKLITERLDIGYKVFKNNPLKVAYNYAPTKEVIKQAEADLKVIANNLPNPVKLTNTETKKLVEDIWKTAYVDKSFLLTDKGSILFKNFPPNIRKNFMAESFADKAAKFSSVQLKQLNPEVQKLANRLLGKDDNAMSTILQGTNVLSTVIRRDAHFADQLINSNNIKVAREAKIKELVKQGMSVEEASAKAPIQTYFDTEEALLKATGARTGDYSQIGTVKPKVGQVGYEGMNAKVDRSKVRSRLEGEIDPKTGKPIWKEEGQFNLERPSEAELLKDYQIGAGKQGNETFDQYLKRNNVLQNVEVANINPLVGKWTLQGNYDALFNVNKNLVNPESGWAMRLYANTILYPKATSQMAKTILSPFTHMRNFLSAGAFATANGIIPFIGPGEGAARKALQALQLGPRTKKGNAIYQELLSRGVVNSQVQLGDIAALMKDVDFGSYLGSKRAFSQLAKVLSRTKRFAQDAYTAEDDFWKIYSYFKEQDRLFAAYKKAGIAEGSTFVNAQGKTVRLNKETMKDEAAAIVRNNIPNYAYVSDFVKGLRQYPLGNFVSFPAEIMRTGTNIVQRGLDEMFYTVKLPNGKVVTPLRSIGLQRLTGMAVTTSAVPYAAVAAGQALYDVSEDEIQAMRRYVAKWSKNSTLIPLRGDDGKLKYIDFSHMNAYDTLTRPIQTVINKVQAGEDDKDGIMDDFILGLFEATKELGEPFISESIWTEALADLYMRGGETRDGFRVYNQNDNVGNQIYNSMAHLIKSQAPLNWKQMERLLLSIKPVDDKGRFDERGRDYEFGNELAGMIGARAIEVQPEKSITYKIADYAKGTRQSKSLFTSEVLKGGVVDPKKIYDAYLNANRALFKVQRTMAQDMEAAQILGMTEDQMETEVLERIGSQNYSALEENIFRPMKITNNSMRAFQEIADELGISNPLDSVIDTLDELKDALSEYSLTNENLPELFNPFDKPIIPNLINEVTNTLPNSVTNNTGFLNESNVSIPDTSGILYNPNESLAKKIDKAARIDSLI